MGAVPSANVVPSANDAMIVLLILLMGGSLAFALKAAASTTTVRMVRTVGVGQGTWLIEGIRVGLADPHATQSRMAWALLA